MVGRHKEARPTMSGVVWVWHRQALCVAASPLPACRKKWQYWKCMFKLVVTQSSQPQGNHMSECCASCGSTTILHRHKLVIHTSKASSGIAQMIYDKLALSNDVCLVTVSCTSALRHSTAWVQPAGATMVATATWWQWPITWLLVHPGSHIRTHMERGCTNRKAGVRIYT